MAAPNEGLTTLPADSAGKSHLGYWNSASYDALRSCLNQTLLASAARTATTSSPLQTNPNAKGVLILVNVSVAGTGNLGVQLQMTTFSSKLVNLFSHDAILTTTGRKYFLVYPGLVTAPDVGTGQITKYVNLALPRSWSVNIVHSDSSSWTYDVDASTFL